MKDQNRFFIGRVKQKDRFKQILGGDVDKKKRIVFVYDAVEDPEIKGGVGKTWLLNMFVNIASSAEFKDKYLVIDEIFDLKEPINQDHFNRLLKLVRLINEKLPTDHFQPFWDRAHIYYDQRLTIESILEVYHECYRNFCNDTNKTVIRFYDTFENTTIDFIYIKGKYRFVSDDIIDNSMIVIGSRFPPEYDKPIWGGRRATIEEMPLTGFSLFETTEFFEREGIIGIRRSDIEIINDKAEGRPILLALAADLINSRISTVDDLIHVSKEEFKVKLINFILEFAKPTDLAVLAMAHLHHRCDKNILEAYLGKQVENYDLFLSQLLKLSFVRPISRDKSMVVLHDEVQRLINQFIFCKIDSPDMKIRRDLSEIVIKNYYEKEIENKEAEIIQKRNIIEAQALKGEIASLKSEMWYHKLFLKHDNENFNVYFHELFDPALEDGKLDYCLSLLSQMDYLDKLINFDQYAKNRLALRRARVYSELLEQTGDIFYYESAKTIFKELEKDAKKAKRATRFFGIILLEIGILYFYKGILLQAEKYFKRSIEKLAQEYEQNNYYISYLLGKAYNWYGYNQYNQGFLTDSIKLLNMAEDYILKSERLIKYSDIPEILKKFRLRRINFWLAQIRGNLCRLYYEDVEDLDRAVRYGESSLEIRRRLIKPVDIIRGLNSLGLAYARKGEFAKSQELYIEAERLLKINPHKVLEARIRINHATSLFKLDQFSNLFEKCLIEEFDHEAKSIQVSSKEFKEAQFILQNVIEQMLPLNNRELSIAYLCLGELLFIMKKFDESEKNFLEGKKIAKKRHDYYTLMNILQRIVLVNYHQRKETLFFKNKIKFENEIKKIKNLEVIVKYIVKFYIIMGNYYFEKALNLIQLKVSDTVIIDGLKNAFNYYVIGYDYSKRDSSKWLQLLTLEIYNRRLSSLSKLNIAFNQDIIDSIKV